MPRMLARNGSQYLLLVCTIALSTPAILVSENDDQIVSTITREELNDDIKPIIGSSSDDELAHDIDDGTYEEEEEEEYEELDDRGEPLPPSNAAPRRIQDIIIHGNKHVPANAILSRIPYKVGELFNPMCTRTLIQNLYFDVGHFRNVVVKGELIGQDSMKLHIFVEEKQPIKDFIITGNSKISETDIRKKIDFDVPAVDAEELQLFALQIKKLYAEKGYNDVSVSTDLQIDDDGKGIATLTVDENKRSTVKQINFEGNECISSKELRNAIFTREDWVLGFMDGSGIFIPERLAGDRHMIEQLYQNRGYMQAKVVDTDISIDPCSKDIILTFDVEEGERYIISHVSAPGNETVPEEYILPRLPVRVGDYYSREKLANTIKALESFWGDFGYIFATVDPIIEQDEDTKTVSVSFISDLGSKVTLNRINIRGNRKTRDKVIRRQLLIEEGCPLVQSQMEASRLNVESLGYFEPRDGVNWKIHRISEDEADLDLILNEAKTGNFNAQAGFGGTGVDLRSPVSGLTVKGVLSDRNLFGMGIDFNIEGSWAKEEQTINVHLAQHWLFDKPLSGAIDIYHRRPTYDELRNIQPRPVNEKLTGFGAALGFITPLGWGAPFGGTQLLMTAGLDSVHYETPPQAQFFGPQPLAKEQYQIILDKEFNPGNFGWVSTAVEQNRINHPIHPSNGHKVRWYSKYAIPSFGDNIGFYRTTLEADWFTPLINEYMLVFHLRAFFGLATPFGDRRTVPFGDLYHIGGQNSVRGYTYGQIGPKFEGDTIGGKKAFFVNTELIFPITPDMNIKGVVFYDGGAGWDNPYVTPVNSRFITDNRFDYRHAVGIGVRMLQPMPLRVDWGFKIDPRPGESGYEIHFGMNYNW